VLFRLIDEAPRHLAAGGTLMLEISPEQSEAVPGRMDSSGKFQDIRVVKDLPGLARVVRGRYHVG
jgi:release factor glutamine methyltransferase